MKTLLLARHGTAEERQEGTNDFDRKLTETGKKESAIAGKRLRRMNLIPEIIISSPAPRALRTAEFIAEKIKFPQKKIRTEKIIYTGNVQQALRILGQISGIRKVVMVCGHNPLLEEIFSSLCEGLIQKIHKGDIIGIAFHMDDWKNIKINTGEYIFTITQNKNSKQQNMKNNSPKNKKKELQAQVSDLIHAFAKSKTRVDSKKVRKSVKQASKLIAKAIYKTLNEQPKVKRQTVKKKTEQRVKGIKTKPAAKKSQAKKTVRPKSISKNIFSSRDNISEKISVVENNPLQV